MRINHTVIQKAISKEAIFACKPGFFNTQVKKLFSMLTIAQYFHALQA